MASSMPPPARRRRGPQLEAALLHAAWDELVWGGYANLTMESVAARAHTGIAVLYRRWPNKDKLAIAAIDRYRTDHPVEIPDTGALREDLLALLTATSTARSFMVGTIAAFSGLLADTGLTIAQVRDRLLGDEPLRRVEIVYRRAHDRGEIDLERITPAVLAMPFDLVRHDLLMNLEPVKRDRIESIVDELFLPLVRRGVRTDAIEGP